MATQNQKLPNQFDVVSAGSRKDGAFWAQIKNEKDGFVVRAFVVTTTEQKAGEVLTIPTAFMGLINWQF
jgi:hypothetical protein